ncbi:MAG TPA: hypothetical protein VHW69_11370 [Rhizomicrobium sp.]|jgi:hypothetical protein|nr:hypothetical protein [Rhizomicrobium sp.]
MAAYEDAVRKSIIIVVILVVVGVVWVRWTFPSISYRYRLSVAVEVDGKVHSGSTVIGVWFRFYPRPLSFVFNTFEERVSGQAALIDLGARGVLVVALGGPDRCDVSAGDLFGRAYETAAARHACVPGYPRSIANELHLSHTTGSVELTADNMPLFIWFPDKSDPKTAQFVKPVDFTTTIGDLTRLSAARVEITQDPVVVDIDKKLPLYNRLPPPTGSDILRLPDGRYLNWSMFIAPGSV